MIFELPKFLKILARQYKAKACTTAIRSMCINVMRKKLSGYIVISRLFSSRSQLSFENAARWKLVKNASKFKERTRIIKTIRATAYDARRKALAKSRVKLLTPSLF